MAERTILEGRGRGVLRGTIICWNLCLSTWGMASGTKSGWKSWAEWVTTAEEAESADVRSQQPCIPGPAPLLLHYEAGQGICPVACSPYLICWVELWLRSHVKCLAWCLPGTDAHLQEQSLNTSDNSAPWGGHLGAALWLSIVWGIQAGAGGGGRRPLRVLELDYNHSFSASLAELRSLHICIALVLVFRGANSSESQDVSVVFALSPLLFLPPRPTWTQLGCDSVYFVENSVP